jgi:preprotein translocase subunit YajC
MYLQAAPDGGGNLFSLLIPFILMFVVFYFLLIRPQQKRNKLRNQMLSALKKGDKVVTIGGLHGTIDSLTDDIVVLKVNDVTKLTFDRSAVNNVVSSPNVDERKADKQEEAKEQSGDIKE